MDNLERDQQKEIVKQAIKEWLDEKYASFGKWTLHGIVAASLCALVYFLATHGWIKA